MAVIDTDEPKAGASPAIALTEQLRDGPLQELINLQRRANELALRMAASSDDHLGDLAELVRLSLAAMERFHGFTLEFKTLLHELADVERASH